MTPFLFIAIGVVTLRDRELNISFLFFLRFSFCIVVFFLTGSDGSRKADETPPCRIAFNCLGLGELRSFSLLLSRTRTRLGENGQLLRLPWCKCALRLSGNRFSLKVARKTAWGFFLKLFLVISVNPCTRKELIEIS